MDFEAVCHQIEKTFARLSPQLKQAARFALDHPDDVALQSMRRLSAMAAVHPSTMVRLVKELGLDGYTAFQEPFQSPAFANDRPLPTAGMPAPCNRIARR
ncbi:hypothetical protein JCM17960_28810 [Magnetospira thiophila]